MHVDDETGFLESTKQILEMNAPVRVYAAASVEEAKEILKTSKVDVIVSDYQMPVENGLKFLKELRETNVDIPFILFTGMGREKVAIEALNGSVGELSLVNEKLSVVGALTWHDVRNKLSVVAGNLFIAKELLPQDHAVMKYLQKAEPAFDQIIQIFDRARTYERLGVDKLSYIGVNQSCDEAVSLVHDLGNIKVVKDCKGLTVYADPLLGQLFYNLIDNSIKHGEKVSKIRMYYKESEDGLKLIYEDDGVGIVKAEKKKMFGRLRKRHRNRVAHDTNNVQYIRLDHPKKQAKKAKEPNSQLQSQR